MFILPVYPTRFKNLAPHKRFREEGGRKEGEERRVNSWVRQALTSEHHGSETRQGLRIFFGQDISGFKTDCEKHRLRKQIKVEGILRR